MKTHSIYEDNSPLVECNVQDLLWRCQIYYISVGGDDGDDVDDEKEENVSVSESNTFASETSKLSVGARILRGPLGPEILVSYKV